MKKQLSGIFAVIILVLVASFTITFSSCTENVRARKFGGNETINLPKGKRLVNVTWKESNLWYITEDMPIDYTPETKVFEEHSSLGLMEGKVIFIESK